ncbi:uncharacterized protein LOC116956911 isoform X3 [Petromyzon marinus]|uniref:uncharacterized protein LOC116956911 isoform X3 n=1 Tax=Petromyzon marinus TaxID=7757 RepID=UPI003F6E97B6
MPGKILAELEGTTAAPTTEPKKVKGEKRRRQKGGDAETTMEEENEKETPEEVKRAKKAKKRERRQEEEEETQTVPEKSPKKKKKRKSEESEEAQVVEEVEVEPKKPKSSSKKRKLPPTSPPSPASAKGEEAPLSAASISSTTSSLSGEEVEAGGNAEVLSEEQIAGAFSNFNISDKTISLLRGRGVSYLFPVQCLSLEPIMAGWDLVAQARTGTGKTLAFAIPLVELLRQRHGTGSAAKYGRLPQVLVMCPTRELAVQVADDLRAIAAPLRVACFYGGTAYGPQLQQIRSGLDVLVGTPGRLRDLIQNHGLRLRAKHNNEEEDSSKKKKDEEVVVVEEVEKDEKKGGKKNGGKEEGVRHVVLDEVDQMLDMGFADQVEEILGCIYSKASPENNPQTLLFSATCPPWVFKVAQKFMKETWRRVDLMGTEKTRAATTVQHLAVCCPRSERAVCLGSVLRVYAAGLPGGHAVNPVGSSGGHGVASVGSSRGRAIVFCETKKEAAELALSPAIAQEAQCLHGDVPQQQREACLCLSVSLSVCPTVCVSQCVSVSVCLSVCVSQCVSVSQCPTVCVSQCLCVSVCVCVSVSHCLCVSVSVCVCVSVSVCPTVCVSQCVSVSQCMYLTVCVFNRRLSVCTVTYHSSRGRRVCVSVSQCLCVSVSVCPTVCVSQCVSVSRCMYLTVCVFNRRLSVCTVTYHSSRGRRVCVSVSQ